MKTNLNKNKKYLESSTILAKINVTLSVLKLHSIAKILYLHQDSSNWQQILFSEGLGRLSSV